MAEEGPVVDVDFAHTPLYEKVVGKEAAERADKLFNTPTSARRSVDPEPDNTVPKDPTGPLHALFMVFLSAFFLGGLTVYVIFVR